MSNKITPICNIVLQQGLILVIRQSKNQMYYASLTNEGRIEHAFHEKSLSALMRRAFGAIRQHYRVYSAIQSFNWSDGMPYNIKPIGF